MKYTDYSVEAILDWDSKQETVCKKIKEEIIDDGEIMKCYKREKYPTLDQLEHISLQLDIKISTLKTWYRNQRQQERKTPPRTPPQDQGLTSSHSRTIIPPHLRTTTPPHSSTKTPLHLRTKTPPQPRTITPRVSPTVQSPPSFKDGTHHPYFQLISEKIGISPPKTDDNDETSPRISPSQQTSPILSYQRLQNQALPGRHTVPQVLPLYHPFSQPFCQLYYGSPYLQYPVSTPSSLDNTQPLDLSKPVSQSSPENHGIKQSNSRDQPASPFSPENHSIKLSNSPDQTVRQSSPENQGIKQSNSPDQLGRNNPEKQSSPNLTDTTRQTSPQHQARTKTSPESINQATTQIRTKPTKTSKARSTPSPKLNCFLLSPPEKSSLFGSGLRQLVIEGRSFSP